MKFSLVSFIFALSIYYSVELSAGEFEFKPSLDTSLIHSQNVLASEKSDANIFSVKPSLLSTYKSKGLSASLSFDHNHVKSEINDKSQSDSFTNYQYVSDISLIKSILSLKLTGGQAYRSILASQYLVNDAYLGADSLSKTRNNSATVLLNLPARKYFGLQLNAGLSEVKSARSADKDQNLNNKRQFIEARLFQGKDFTRLSWSLDSSYQNTDRAADNDLTSRVVSGNIGLGLFSNLRLVFTGRTEENKLANSNNLSIDDLNYDSYGAGFSWFSSANRNFSITFNQAERVEQDEEEEETFVGFDLNWAFTSRTSIQANLGKRFFGDSGTFAFTHNTKHLRTQISYNEELTTLSRLVAVLEDQGVFVCPIGNSSFSDCFQPDSLNYQLQPGEQFTNLLAQVPELSEQITLRKALNASIGWSRKKLTSSLSFTHSNTEYIESDRLQKANIASFTSSLQVSGKSSVNLSVNYAQIDEEFSTDTSTRATETISASLGLSRQLSKKMKTDLDFRYLKRSADNEDEVALDPRISDLTDRRLTLTLSYMF